jgi:hypothetical protein
VTNFLPGIARGQAIPAISEGEPGPANLYPARSRDDLPGVARLLTLSGNVVAIALTLVDAFIFLALAMVLTRTGSLAVRSGALRRARAPELAAAADPPPGPAAEGGQEQQAA